MTIAVLSPAREQKLVEAMVKTVHAVNAGADPDQEIAKQANAYGFGPAFAERMVEAFNASKQLKHLKTASAEHRADTIPLANKEQVLRNLYSPVVKAASARIDDPSQVNLNQPDGLTAVFEKAAAVLETPVERPRRWQTDTILRETRGSLQMIKQAREETHRELLSFRDTISQSLSDFGQTMREPGHEPFADVEQRMTSIYGPILGKRACDLAWDMLNEQIQRTEKRASELRRCGPSNSRSFRLISGAAETMKKAAALKAELMAFEKKANAVEKALSLKLGFFHKSAGKPTTIYVNDLTGASPDVRAKVNQMQAERATQGRQINLVDISTLPAQAGPHQPSFAEAQQFATSVHHVLGAHEQEQQEKALDLQAKQQRLVDQQARNAQQAAREQQRLQTEKERGQVKVQYDPNKPEDKETIQRYLERHFREKGTKPLEVVPSAEGLPLESLKPVEPTPGEQARAELADIAEMTGHIGTIGQTLKSIPNIFAKEKAPEIESILDPRHEAALRDIRIKTMVNDMISNDPILSSYPPVDVVGAFNQVANLMPSLADKPLVMRALVSRTLQQGGNVDPAELVSMLTAEKTARGL